MTTDQMLLEALKAHLQGKIVDWEDDISSEQWKELVTLSVEHSVLPMVFEAICKCPAIKSMDVDMLMMLRGQVTQLIMMQVQKSAEFSAIYHAFDNAKVKPLVVKGIVCRSIYPNPDCRMSSDEDLLIEWNEFAEVHQLLMDTGMQLNEPEKDIEQEFEVPYLGQTLLTELHKQLFSPDSKAYGDFNEIFADIRENPVQINIDGTVFYTLNPTNHLAYLIAHSLKHFLHGGFGIRQVCDIDLFAAKFDEQIDWAVVSEKCKAMKALHFAAALFAMGEKYLGISCANGMKVSELGSITASPEHMLADLLDSGIYGGADMSRKHSSTITLNAVAAEKAGKEAKASILKTVFPPARDISGRYPYLIKYPFLVPIAWANRLATYRKEMAQMGGNQAKEAMQIGQDRIELLKEYKLLDK